MREIAIKVHEIATDGLPDPLTPETGGDGLWEGNPDVPRSDPPHFVRLASVMRRAGWEIEHVDLDFTGERPRVEIKVMRTDGRWLFATVDSHGRATIERFQRNMYLGHSSHAKGRVPMSEQIEDVFLGRDRYQGGRAMLRGLTAYIADNAIQPVALADIRAAWAGVMREPTHWNDFPAPPQVIETTVRIDHHYDIPDDGTMVWRADSVVSRIRQGRG